MPGLNAMFVSLLQLMGFPAGKAVHSRASENSGGKSERASQRGITVGKSRQTENVRLQSVSEVHAQASSARRQEVKAKPGKAKAPSKAPVKAPKVVAKAKPAKKAVAKPAVKPVAKTKPAAKPAAKPVSKPVKVLLSKSTPTWNFERDIVEAAMGNCWFLGAQFRQTQGKQTFFRPLSRIYPQPCNLVTSQPRNPATLQP